jgi:hypothetical protein
MPEHPSRETFSHLNYSYAVHFQRTNPYLVSLNSTGHTTTAHNNVIALAGFSGFRAFVSRKKVGVN